MNSNLSSNSLVIPMTFVGSFLTSVFMVKDSGYKRTIQRLSIIALNILGKCLILKHLPQKKSLKKRKEKKPGNDTRGKTYL